MIGLLRCRFHVLLPLSRYGQQHFSGQHVLSKGQDDASYGREKEASDEGSCPDGGAPRDSGYHTIQRGSGRPVGVVEIEAGKTRPLGELVKEPDLEAKA